MKKAHHDDCGVCKVPSFERNNYYYGKMMTVRDFCQEQAYFNEKRWLINRMALGWGIVCGLDVYQTEQEANKIVITPGLAIDCCGREILLCRPWEKSIIELKEEHKPKQPIAQTQEQTLVICLRYRECETEPVRLPPIACDDKEITEYNRIRDSYDIEIKKIDEVVIPEPFGDCCALMESKQPCPPKKTEKSAAEGDAGLPDTEKYRLQPYLCNKLKQGCPDCEQGHCLILAKLVLVYQPDDDSCDDDRQGYQHHIEIDACYKRRLVYGNSLLYELIHCFHGDLPHIVGSNWSSCYNDRNEMKFAEFKSLIERGPAVDFDMAMDPATINKHTFYIVVITEDDDTGYRVPRYIPAAEITLINDGRTAIFKADQRWITDIFGGRSRIRRHGADVEVVIRGSLITNAVNETGKAKALDGDFVGNKFPTGNGVQGGDFVSCFSVLPDSNPIPPQWCFLSKS